MKRIALLLIILCIGGVIVIMLFDGQTDVKKIIKERYTNQQGLIHAYPDQTNSEYLSESIGLYMEYLVNTKQEDAFEKQVDHLKASFIKDGTYIKWRLKDGETTNAIIDDVRIIASLKKAAEIFDQQAYRKLAVKLTQSISQTQTRNGYYVDYYDWSFEDPGDQITLSYITPAFCDILPDSEKTERLLSSLDEGTVFFPESFNVTTEAYNKNAEVHMVDQLLIALNRENQGLPSPAFRQWLTDQWNQGTIYGRYDRKRLEPTASHESVAVYALAAFYYQQIGEQDRAEDIITYSETLYREMRDEELHFFDFIHYHLSNEYIKRRNP
ncbi:hypothetical protein [Halobacillus salinus]|uniref:Glycoside transferase n=1 Tax=Halobacillus salinus TaxID=192814 RepID=A0A4Z0GZ33_9BACI|nr:hypothetical protein [Halobacillus salinus]TGB02471.1 hypothetical protein E4663_14135 [Halobacillus salinus]